jgi:hypothetical protein
MMINLPQTLATEVGDAVNALIHESDRFRNWNDAEVRTVVRTIEKLQKVDAREAFVRFGAIAAICGNVDDVFAYYDKALRLPGEAETKHEFCASLGNAGLYSKAQEICSWLLDPKRGFFPKVWQRAVGLGKVLEVWNRLSDAKRTYPDLSQVDFSTVENAVAIMGAHGLSDQDIVSVLDLMGEIQRAHRIMFSGALVSILKVMRPPEDPPYLYFTIPLDAGVGEIHAMNRELARLVVERLPEGAFPQGMVASFAKAEPLALRAAA